MKNRYLKGAHLSERKVRELLKLFCEDLTATQIANITGISRITVNAYFKLIRSHIASFCEEKSSFHYTNGTANMLSSGNGHETVNGKEIHFKKSFYGIYKKNDFIFTHEIAHIEASWLYDWLKGKIEAGKELIEQHHLHLYSGIADFNNVRLFRVDGTTPN